MSQLDKHAALLLFFYGVGIITFCLWLLFTMAAVPTYLIGGLNGLLVLLVVWLVVSVGTVAAGWLWAIYYARSYHYTLANDALTVSSGIVFKSNISIPRARIQKVDIFRGPLERLLGVSVLKVSTASPNESTVSLPGLPASEAESFRKDLLAI